MHHSMYNYIQWMGAALETSNVCRMEDIDARRPAMLLKPKENPGSGSPAGDLHEREPVDQQCFCP